jgi:hypothetical protein
LGDNRVAPVKGCNPLDLRKLALQGGEEVRALMQGIHRYNKQFNNLDLIFYNQLVKLKDPVKEIRADESHVALLIDYESAIKIGLINVVRMMRKIGLKPHICTKTKGKLSIVGLRDYSAIKNLMIYSLEYFNL